MIKKHQNDFSVSGPENLAWAKKWLIPDIIIHLKKTVKADKLSEAVVSALALHPLYQTALVQNEKGEPIRILNPQLPIIKKFNSKERIFYGTPKYHRYSWLIRYSGKKIVVSISHMLSDGTGALRFIQSVLQYYFEKTGEMPLTVSQGDINRAYTRTENAYLKYGRKGRPLKQSECVPPTRISPKILLKDQEHLQTSRFIIKKNKIKKLSVQYHVRPFTITAALFAKALAQTLGISNGVIDLPVPVNCRNYFPSATDRNFIYPCPLKYDIGKMAKADLKSVAQEFNRQFNEGTTKKNMLSFFHEISEMTNVFKQSMEIALGFRKNANKMNNERTATICYSHITRTDLPPEFENLIDTIEVAALPPREGAVAYIFGFNFKEEITFSVKHIFKDNAYVHHLIKLFKQEKIDFTLSKSHHQCLAKFYTVK